MARPLYVLENVVLFPRKVKVKQINILATESLMTNGTYMYVCAIAPGNQTASSLFFFLYVILISSSFGVSGRLYFVIVIFP